LSSTWSSTCALSNSKVPRRRSVNTVLPSWGIAKTHHEDLAGRARRALLGSDLAAAPVVAEDALARLLLLVAQRGQPFRGAEAAVGAAVVEEDLSVRLVDLGAL